MKIHILTDNTVRKRGFLAEHGLSVLIEFRNGSLLFDTGQTDVYCRNAARMGLDLKKADAVVLSHGHYDHCGGLPRFPSEEIPAVYVRPGAFGRRLAADSGSGGTREIGIPWIPEETEKIRRRVVEVQGRLTEIRPGVSLCSEIPFIEEFEPKPEGFFREAEDGTVRSDLFPDEQVLVVENGGLSVFLGCSHPGVINCLEAVRALFPGRRVDLVAGGMHLEHAGPRRLQSTIRYLEELDIPKIIPLHCTGFSAVSEMKRRLAGRCLLLNAGDSLELRDDE